MVLTAFGTEENGPEAVPGTLKFMKEGGVSTGYMGHNLTMLLILTKVMVWCGHGAGHGDWYGHGVGVVMGGFVRSMGGVVMG